MKRKQVNIQKWNISTNVKAACLQGWKGRLCCIFVAMFVAIANLYLPVYATSDTCNGEHNNTTYYNDYIKEQLPTDYCQDCGHIEVHPCLYPLRFMTVGTTYSYANPSKSSASELLTNSAKHNVNVTGRVRNGDGELWLLLDNGAYISADSVAFNFDYYAEDAVKNASNFIENLTGMFLTFNPYTGKSYNMKIDELLGNTYLYKLYSSGLFLPERYSGEQIGNMMYGYASAAKGFSYYEAMTWAERATEKEDSPEDKRSILLGYNYRKNGTWFREISSQYVGKTVAIKSVEVDKYVSSNTDQDVKGINAVANRDSAGTWELFTVKEGAAGAVGFLSTGNGNYLSARLDENEEYAYIQAAFGHDYSSPQSWESFRIFEYGDVQYIQSQANGKWVQVSVNESDYPIKAAADIASTWERFRLEIDNGDGIASSNMTSDATRDAIEASTSGDYSEENISASTKVSQPYWGSDYNEGWYEGEWSNGKPNGYGKLTYDDFEDNMYYSISIGNVKYKALYYEGNFLDGWRYGTGKVVYEGGWEEEGTYYGAWTTGKKVFEGTFWHKDGTHYLECYLTAASSCDADYTWLTNTWQE